MPKSYNSNDDRPLKGGRFFQCKRCACGIAAGAALLLGIGVYLSSDGPQKHSAQPVSAVASQVQRTAVSPSPDEGGTANAPAANTEAETTRLATTPWAEQMRALRELAANSPDEAIARISSIDDKHERKAATASVCPIIAAANPAKAMIAAWALDLGRFSDEAKEISALDVVARRWAEVDPVSALKWVSALPLDEESRRDYVVRGIASVLARESPDIAADLVAKHTITDGSLQIGAALEVVQYWASRDQTAARKWIERLPEGALRTRCLEQLLR